MSQNNASLILEKLRALTGKELQREWDIFFKEVKNFIDSSALPGMGADDLVPKIIDSLKEAGISSSDIEKLYKIDEYEYKKKHIKIYNEAERYAFSTLIIAAGTIKNEAVTDFEVENINQPEKSKELMKFSNNLEDAYKGPLHYIRAFRDVKSILIEEKNRLSAKSQNEFRKNKIAALKGMIKNLDHSIEKIDKASTSSLSEINNIVREELKKNKNDAENFILAMPKYSNSFKEFIAKALKDLSAGLKNIGINVNVNIFANNAKAAIDTSKNYIEHLDQHFLKTSSQVSADVVNKKDEHSANAATENSTDGIHPGMK